jgi:manganese/iron transport system substrate-binding protein
LPALRLIAAALSLLVAGLAGLPPAALQAQDRPLVVTTVAPLSNIALNVGGNRIRLAQIVPDGADSHTFEPSPSDAQTLGRADLIVVNGLNLETGTMALAEANRRDSARLLSLGEQTVSPEHWIFDFSFPADQGDPNPHLWMNPLYALRYAELIRDQLKEIDPAGAGYYDQNTARFAAKIGELDWAIATTIQTIPPEHRKLLTYHDSFAYFAPRYGLTVIGAIQPSDFAEPSPREVAALIDQLRAERVPAIFGSEVFPSRILDQLAREAGIVYIETLRDDDLPGPPSAPEHTYVGMLVEDVTTMARALGGTSAAIEAVDPANTFLP